MRAVIQRVTRASVTIGERMKAEIREGLLILAGFEESDNNDDIDWLTNKIVNLRIFNDADGIMNLSVKDTGGEILVVSQFTLHAKTKKGNRPSYIRAANPEIAVPLYNSFVKTLGEAFNKEVKTGEFGAMMMIESVNDGPVTIIIDTKNKE
ncbi:MAG TPA: D-aminoacyl-tRNA deacylase [Bacteroidales bacterium]|nr:D-aminoacyl-tRNA deacylase [Bacteroidales bacterium]